MFLDQPTPCMVGYVHLHIHTSTADSRDIIYSASLHDYLRGRYLPGR